jgi:hypothetical protein
MKHKQLGFGTIEIILFVIIIALLGFIAWNFFQQNTKNDVTAANDKYLDIPDWKIKFKIPSTLSDLKYYKQTAAQNTSGATAYYGLTTSRVEALGEQCIEPSSTGVVRYLAQLQRTQKKTDNPEQVGGTALFGNNLKDGYYYYVSRLAGNCSSSSVDIQAQDKKAILDMLSKPESY